MFINFFNTMFLLSLVVLILVFIRVYFFKGFGRSFIHMLFFLLIMVIVNFICILSKSILTSLLILVFLSFYSMFLIIYGYGNSFKVVIVILFKSFADFLIVLIVSYFLFLGIDSFNKSSLFFGFGIQLVLILIYLIYSLCGVFGFWLFWGMEASSFLSSFMHSCGFIAVGVVFLIKLSLTGCLEGLGVFTSFISFISFLSYLGFLNMFFLVKDCKKSFGFYSISSICLLMFLSVNCPGIALSYFFLSAVLKILVFDVLSFLNKLNILNWLIFFLMSFSIFLYQFMFLLSIYNSFSFYLEIILYIYLFKAVSISLFWFKVLSVMEIESFFIREKTIFLSLFVVVLICNKVFVNFVYTHVNILGGPTFSMAICFLLFLVLYLNKFVLFCYWGFYQKLMSYGIKAIEKVIIFVEGVEGFLLEFLFKTIKVFFKKKYGSYIEGQLFYDVLIVICILFIMF